MRCAYGSTVDPDCGTGCESCDIDVDVGVVMVCVGAADDCCC